MLCNFTFLLNSTCNEKITSAIFLMSLFDLTRERCKIIFRRNDIALESRVYEDRQGNHGKLVKYFICRHRFPPALYLQTDRW